MIGNYTPQPQPHQPPMPTELTYHRDAANLWALDAFDDHHEFVRLAARDAIPVAQREGLCPAARALAFADGVCVRVCCGGVSCMT
jgi:hypothetical protein